MEKTIANRCPRCHKSGMNVYFEDDSRTAVGAWCEACNLMGFFVDETPVYGDSGEIRMLRDFLKRMLRPPIAAPSRSEPQKNHP